MADLLVTGTDTGVGKTVIAAALVIALRERQVRAVGWKPVETGVTPDEESDSDVLAKASGPPEPRAQPLLRLPEPLAPAVAAERAGRALSVPQLEQGLRDLRALGYRLVVEGAGGLLVPLAWGYTALDLAERLGLELVIVGRTGLGTLNHVTLTAEACRHRSVRIRGVVLNGRLEPPDLAERTNPDVLRRLLPGVPVLVVPRHDTSDSLLAAYASVPLVVSLL
jgi:dethiobiotin synthetase